MDLGAYARIEELRVIAEKNGIEIPRCRGYRLMKDENPVSADEMNVMIKRDAVNTCAWLCRANPFWNPNSNGYTFSNETDSIVAYFIGVNPGAKENGWDRYTGIRWDRIHGKKRKILKFELKKQKQKIYKQFGLWNKYAGREDVLYIHSRMGGYNWKGYDGKEEIMSQPWFLDRVDDYFDDTYCDFYAKIVS